MMGLTGGGGVVVLHHKHTPLVRHNRDGWLLRNATKGASSVELVTHEYYFSASFSSDVTTFGLDM